MGNRPRCSLLAKLWNLLGHNAVWDFVKQWQNVVPFITGGLFVNVRSIVNWFGITAAMISSAFFFAGWAILAILAAIYGVRIVKRWRSWRLVHFRDLRSFFSFDPFLRALVWYKRRNLVPDKLREVLRKFVLPNGSPYFEYQDGVIGGIHVKAVAPTEQPTIVFKLLVRHYLAVPDFFDLRLLRHLVYHGARVIVVLQDVPFGIVASDVPTARMRTQHFVRRVLGHSARVEFLSELLSDDGSGFVRFLLDEYVPLYASQYPQAQNETTAGAYSDGISYFTFPLIIRGLSRVIDPNTPVVVVQWRERVKKWCDLSTAIARWGGGMRIGGFILGETFPDFCGAKWKTTTQDFNNASFHMTDSPMDVSQKIYSKEERNGVPQWIISDDYIQFLLASLVGLADTSALVAEYQHPQISAASARKRFMDEYIRVYGELWRGLGHLS
ncbi:MAG: hypothetical protein ACYDC8_03640 [Gammaproteobacteria bacterium]